MQTESNDLSGLEPTDPMPTEIVLAAFFRALIDDLRVPALVRLHAIRGYRDLTGFRGEFFSDDEEDDEEEEEQAA